MEKLDPKFYGFIKKVKDDSRVSDDEYVVFLVKDDAFALDALPAYRAGCVKRGADADQLAALDRMIARVEMWRRAFPHACKVPDIGVAEKLLG